ncbi:hypothetical protein AOLI_G00241490 [Acnodon oligacanthus]
MPRKSKKATAATHREAAKGDALYTRVKRALVDEGQYVSDLLTFDELPTTVETDSRCYSVIKHAQRFRFLKDEAPQGMAKYETLD